MRLSIRSSSCRHSKQNTADQLFKDDKYSSKKFSLPASVQSRKSEHVIMSQRHISHHNSPQKIILKDKYQVISTQHSQNNPYSNPFMASHTRTDSKILPIRQLKNIEQEYIVTSRKNPQKKTQKLFVSLSKRNRQGVNENKTIFRQPKLIDVGGQLKLLKDMVIRRRIIDLVQQQFDSKNRKGIFLCN